MLPLIYSLLCRLFANRFKKCSAGMDESSSRSCISRCDKLGREHYMRSSIYWQIVFMSRMYAHVCNWTGVGVESQGHGRVFYPHAVGSCAWVGVGINVCDPCNFAAQQCMGYKRRRIECPLARIPSLRNALYRISGMTCHGVSNLCRFETPPLSARFGPWTYNCYNAIRTSAHCAASYCSCCACYRVNHCTPVAVLPLGLP